MADRIIGPRKSLYSPERMPSPTHLKTGSIPGELGLRGDFPNNITVTLWSKITYHLSGNRTHRHLCQLTNSNYAFYEASVYRDCHSIPVEEGTIWVSSNLSSLISLMNDDCYKTYLEETYAVDANGCPLNPEEATDFGPFQTAISHANHLVPASPTIQ